MYPRTNYKMTQEDMDAILDACKPVPYMIIGGHAPRSQQENANDAWEKLGQKMGFDHMTVQPASSGGALCFTAVPSETEEQRAERVKRESEACRLAEIKEAQNTITAMQAKIALLESMA